MPAAHYPAALVLSRTLHPHLLDTSNPKDTPEFILSYLDTATAKTLTALTYLLFGT